MGWLIAVYGFGLVVVAFIALVLNGGPYGDWRDKRDSARLALIAPVWPIGVPVLLLIYIRYLWRTAEWGKAG